MRLLISKKRRKKWLHRKIDVKQYNYKNREGLTKQLPKTEKMVKDMVILNFSKFRMFFYLNGHYFS